MKKLEPKDLKAGMVIQIGYPPKIKTIESIKCCSHSGAIVKYVGEEKTKIITGYCDCFLVGYGDSRPIQSFLSLKVGDTIRNKKTGKLVCIREIEPNGCGNGVYINLGRENSKLLFDSGSDEWEIIFSSQDTKTETKQKTKEPKNMKTNKKTFALCVTFALLAWLIYHKKSQFVKLFGWVKNKIQTFKKTK